MAAPGVINWLFGPGKRWIAITVLLVAAIALWVGYYRASVRLQESQVFLDDTTRRQVIGDAAVIEKGIRTGWADVFDNDGDRFLSSFAIPGVRAGVRSVAEDRIAYCLEHDVQPLSSDTLEARQIKAMVIGMKEELREFIAAGGTISEYGTRLVQRQEEEIGYYNRVKNELDKADESGMPDGELMALWERRNGQLRAMGIRLVSFPSR